MAFIAIILPQVSLHDQSDWESLSERFCCSRSGKQLRSFIRRLFLMIDYYYICVIIWTQVKMQILLGLSGGCIRDSRVTPVAHRRTGVSLGLALAKCSCIPIFLSIAWRKPDLNCEEQLHSSTAYDPVVLYDAVNYLFFSSTRLKWHLCTSVYLQTSTNFVNLNYIAPLCDLPRAHVCGCVFVRARVRTLAWDAVELDEDGVNWSCRNSTMRILWGVTPQHKGTWPEVRKPNEGERVPSVG